MPKKNKKLHVDESKNSSDEEAFDEADLSDDADGKKGRRRRRRTGQDGEERKKLISDQFMPNSLKKLRACVFCKIVLNHERWTKLEMCPNCADSRGLPDTTDCFESVISLIIPKKSWVAEWQRMQNLIPGIYAMAISPTVQVGEDLDNYDEDFIDDHA